MPGTRPRSVAAEWGVIAVRRLGVIVALGALLGMLGGAVTASPALAGRGPGWSIGPVEPFNPGPVLLWVPGPGDAHSQ